MLCLFDKEILTVDNCSVPGAYRSPQGQEISIALIQDTLVFRRVSSWSNHAVLSSQAMVILSVYQVRFIFHKLPWELLLHTGILRQQWGRFWTLSEVDQMSWRSDIALTVKDNSWKLFFRIIGSFSTRQCQSHCR